MTLTLDDWFKTGRRAEELRRQLDQAEGALSQALETVRHEFGCQTVHEATLKLKRMTRDEGKLFKKWTARYREFRKRYPQFFAQEG